MNPQIESFIGSKVVAVVGYSRSVKKFGSKVGKELMKRGYEIYPVHSEASEIEGVACYLDSQISPDHRIYF